MLSVGVRASAFSFWPAGVGVEGDFDCGDIVGFEGEEFGVGPVFRLEVEVGVKGGEVGFGLGAVAEEAAAGVGGLPKIHGQKFFGGGVEERDRGVFEFEAGDAFGAGGDEAGEFGVGELAHEAGDFLEIGGEVVVGGDVPGAGGVTFDDEGFAGVGEANFGRAVGECGGENGLVEPGVGGERRRGFADQKDEGRERGEADDDEGEGFDFHRVEAMGVGRESIWAW